MFKNVNNYIMLAIIFFALYLTGYFAHAQSYVEKQNAAHINLLENAGFESNLAKWAKVGSLGTFITTSSTTTLLQGKYSAHLTFGSSTQSAAACSNYYDPQSLKNSNGEMGFSYRFSSANPASGTVFVEDASGTVLSKMDLDITLLGEKRDVSKLFAFNDKLVRLCMLGKGTSAIPWGIVLDNTWMGSPRNVTQGPIVTNWETYTPAITGFGTVTNSNLQWRRIGDTLKIRGSWTGSSSSGQARIPFPNGVVATASAYNAKIIGRVGRDGGTSTYLRRYNALVLSNDTNAFALAIEDDQSADPTVPVTGASVNFKIIGELTIPIEGWATTGTAFTGTCKDPYECENTFNLKINSSGTILLTNAPNWVSSCTMGTPNTCTFKSGLFSAPPICNITVGQTSTANTATIRVSDGDITTTSMKFIGLNSGGSAANESFFITCSRSTDHVSKLAVQGYLSETVTTSGGSAREAWATFGAAGSMTSPTACTATCTKYGGDAAIVSAVNVGAGLYDVTVAAGAFSAYELVDAAYYASATAGLDCNGAATSATNIRVYCVATNTSAPTNGSFSITIKGRR